MIQKLFLFILVIATTYKFQAQIKGQVTDMNNNPVAFANVYIQNSYIGTSTNENGFYELPVKKTGNYIVVFKSIGYKNEQKTINITTLPYTINTVLQEETNVLNEMVITAKTEDPAYEIIRNVLANKQKNQNKIKGYAVDFYSKGSFIVDSLPDKILFIDLKTEKEEIDSIKTNYIYLSETFSRLKFEKPNQYNETVFASKVSGNDNGISLNTGLQSNLDFYNNNLKQLDNSISPLSNFALSYYKYKLINTFLDEHNHLINKIQVIPKSTATATFFGDIYIVENSWEIYAVDLKITGKSIKKPFINEFNIQQSFEFNSTLKLWTKQSQAVTIKMGLFGAKIRGNFLYVFNNYSINPEFNSNDFGKTIVTFTENSNKKDSTFWSNNRPIALSTEEFKDYKIRDSLQIVNKNRADSIRIKSNQFKFKKIISGYTYKTKGDVQTFFYSGLLDHYGFNTVQGYFLGSQLVYTKKDTINNNNLSIGTKINYGFSEQRWRATAYINKTINYKTKTWTKISGGTTIVQYNTNNPITNLVNSVATLAFNKNFAKYYNKKFVALNFGTSFIDGIDITTNFEYAQRSALQNNSHVNFLNLNTQYTSNNPLDPLNDAIAFNRNSIAKLNIALNITFGNKYIERPTGKQTITNNRYPSLFLQYENAFASSLKNYNYQNIKATIKYNLNLENYGKLYSNTSWFGFINQNKNLLFIDYHHFNGNQTYIYNNNLVNNQFFLLPYYSHSTQKNALNSHIAYNDKGFIINKIPLLKHTQWNIIANFNILSSYNKATYYEYAVGFDNLGFGKFRLFKLQYTTNTMYDHGIMFGINTVFF